MPIKPIKKIRKVLPSWHVAFEKIEQYVVKIMTPSGSGTGFIVSATSNNNLVGIATAAHVIDFPHYWEQPIRIQHFSSGKTIFLNHEDRVIDTNYVRDTASIVMKRGELPVPENTLPLIKEGMRLKVGVEAAWVGFPVIAPNNLCFFSGTISCWVEDEKFYFVDGVAINGVSGGPAFALKEDNGIQMIGVVSAYVPNRATGAQLPGLCVIRDITPLQKMIKELESLEQAKEAEKLPEAPPPSPSASASALAEPLRS